MAGKKAKTEISDNALVQKARPFFDLWSSGFTLFDFKVFDLYLGSINSHNPQSKIITFEKSAFSKIMGIDRNISTSELNKRLETLVTKLVTIGTDSKYPINTTLLASGYVNTTTQPYTVQLEVSQQLLNLVFHIDKQNGIGYFKYRLRNTLKISSVYSYLMFNFLQSKAYREAGNILATTFTADVDYLKKILNCEDDATYRDFRHFNDKVLKMCHKEITSKTDLQYAYKTIKSGRKVIAIEFTIEPFQFATAQEQQAQVQTLTPPPAQFVPEQPQRQIQQSEPVVKAVSSAYEEFEYLQEFEVKYLLSEIKLKYRDYDEEQRIEKLMGLYYLALGRCKNKAGLMMYIKKTLDSEAIMQQQMKERSKLSDEEEYNDMYDIFINDFVKK